MRTPNEQGMLEGRILTLENMVRNAVIIEEAAAGGGTVRIGTTVELKDEYGKQVYSLVGPAEVDVAAGRISVKSPMGKALMGHSVGDTINVTAPGGQREVKITKIS